MSLYMSCEKSFFIYIYIYIYIYIEFNCDGDMEGRN